MSFCELKAKNLVFVTRWKQGRLGAMGIASLHPSYKSRAIPKSYRTKRMSD
jgi:hypothetical protein